jgi:hypothetical protein
MKVWTPIKNFEQLYEISNCGCIRCPKSNKILVTPVHRLDYSSFKNKAITTKNVIPHIDNDKLNNNINNLKLSDYTELKKIKKQEKYIIDAILQDDIINTLNKNKIWKKIKGYEHAYRLSNFGDVYSIKSKRYLKYYDDVVGFLRVTLNKNNIRKNFYVHMLVYCVFNDIELDTQDIIIHINNDKSDNYINNLKIDHSKKLKIIDDNKLITISPRNCVNNDSNIDHITDSSRELRSELTKNDVINLFKAHVDYCKIKINIYTKLSKKHRLPNFPEDVSENIVKFIIKKIYNYCPSWDTKSGDLCYDGKQLEVKCFSSYGPSSFGPTEKWNELYFLDGTDFLNSKFKCFKINLANDDKNWKEIKINSTETFEDQCKQKRRPRIGFNQIKKQLKDDVELIYSGSFDDIFE